MPTCAQCGQENPDGFRFCGACGASLEAAPPAREVRKVVTVLFADVAGFTAAGERLDPEALRRLQSRYFDDSRAALERHGASVEKFIGDAVLAVFGVPQVHEDDALRAVRAAVDLREAVAPLDIRIGVNTGEVVAGRGDALVTGDAVNTAARLEQAAEPGAILVGEPTYRLVRDAVRAEPVEAVDAKGKAEPVPAYLLHELLVEPAAPRRLDSPLVGRERERRLLRDAFERASEDRACQLFTILGTAGVGKSRLVDEFLDEVGGTASILRGRCLPYGDGITYWPIAEIVRELPTGEPLLDDEDVGRLVTERLQPALGAGEALGRPEEVAWAVRKLFEALADRQRLIVVFDDIHWAEPTFLDLVEHVADWSREAPVLLVCLARPELLDARPGWAGGKLNATSVLLEPLGEADAERLIEHLLGAALDESVCARITEAAEGNPLFVEEMLGMLVDEGALQRANGSWVLTHDVEALTVPPTIRALLAARIDQLDTGERSVLECASVEGKAFHLGAVAHLAPDELHDAVGRHLMTLVRKELVRPQRSDFAGEEGFRFRHLLIRDAAYDALSKVSRADLHERFAGWLETRPGGRAVEYEEIVGYHLEQAFRYRQELGVLDDEASELGRNAAERLGAAGQRALTRHDLPAAVALLERAVGLLPQEDRLRLELSPELGIALTETGQLARADEILVGTITAARETGDRRAEFLSRIQLAYTRALTAPTVMFEDSEREAHAAIAAFEELGDDAGLGRAWQLAGLIAFWNGSAAAAERDYERAIAHARAGGADWRTSASLLWMTGAAYYGPRPAAEVERRLQEILELSGGDWKVDAWVAVVGSSAVAMQGRFDHANALRSRAKASFENLGLLLEQTWASHHFGWLEILVDDLPAAEVELRHGYEVSRRLGEAGYLSTTVAILADVVCEQGRYEEAIQLSEEAEEAATADDVIAQVLWRAARGKALARLGHLEAGESLAREALSRIRRTDDINETAHTLNTLAGILRLAGREDEAHEALAEAIELYERKGNVVMAGRSRAALEE